MNHTKSAKSSSKVARKRTNVFTRLGQHLSRLFRRGARSGVHSKISRSTSDLLNSSGQPLDIPPKGDTSRRGTKGSNVENRTDSRQVDRASSVGSLVDSGISTRTSEQVFPRSGFPPAAFREELSSKLRMRPSPDHGMCPIARSTGSSGSLRSEDSLLHSSSDKLSPVVRTTCLSTPPASSTPGSPPTSNFSSGSAAALHKLAVGRQRARRPPTSGVRRPRESGDNEEDMEPEDAGTASFFVNPAILTSHMSSSLYLDLIEEEDGDNSSSAGRRAAVKLKSLTTGDAVTDQPSPNADTHHCQGFSPKRSRTASAEKYPTSEYVLDTQTASQPISGPHSPGNKSPHTALSNPAGDTSQTELSHNASIAISPPRRRSTDVPANSSRRPFSMFVPEVAQTPFTKPKQPLTPPERSRFDSGSSGPISQEELVTSTCPSSANCHSTRFTNDQSEPADDLTSMSVVNRASIFGEIIQFNKLTTSPPSRISPPLRPPLVQDDDMTCIRRPESKTTAPEEHRVSRVIDLVKNFEGLHT